MAHARTFARTHWSALRPISRFTAISLGQPAGNPFLTGAQDVLIERLG
jgi:hypothetical protein